MSNTSKREGKVWNCDIQYPDGTTDTIVGPLRGITLHLEKIEAAVTKVTLYPLTVIRYREKENERSR